MKKTSIFLILLLICLSLSGCAGKPEATDIAATTLPVFEFTQALCHGTDLTVGRLISEPVSCLHDYSLNVNQVRQAESADLIILSGAGLEEFIELMALADIDISDPPPSGNMILTLNGQNASFMDLLHEGDSVVIKWEL